MSKQIDLSRSVHDLVKEYPELADIMAGLGFTDITKKAALNTMGRIMTIPKGAAVKKIDMGKIVKVLEQNGFEITGAGAQEKKTSNEDAGGVSEADGAGIAAQGGASSDRMDPEEKGRTALLTSYVLRLTKGENLETVRRDFVENFKDVDPAEIARAEQTLITAGVPIPDVQRLCDVHSALFHGATRTEQIANAEKAVEASVRAKASRTEQADAGTVQETNAQAQETAAQAQGTAAQTQGTAAQTQGTAAQAQGTAVQAQGTLAQAQDVSAQKTHPVPPARQDGADLKFRELCGTQGHPLQIFMLEDRAITEQLAVMRKAAAEGGNDILAQLDRTRQIAVHYAKKGDLLYPVLKTKYGFSGPSDVMWGVDDEIRDEMKDLSGEAHADAGKMQDAKWEKRLDAVLTRAEEMVYKEENILFPLCARLFAEDDWKQIARDMRGYELCLTEDAPVWEEAMQDKSDRSGAAVSAAGGNEEIVFGSGHMTPHQLEAVLNTIPLELTFVDENNINRFFNDNGEPKLFKRPLAALDREVFTCHPPKVEPMVRMIIQDFRDGRRDSVEVWNSRGGEPVLIRYMAVRDKEGNYVGTLECVQRMGFAQEHFLKSRK